MDIENVECHFHSVDILPSAKPVEFCRSFLFISEMSNTNEKIPIGKSANIKYTRCDCRKCACCAIYYQADMKRHIKTVKSSTFIQSKKYEFEFKNK